MHELGVICKVSQELERIAAEHRSSRVISAVIEVGQSHHTLEDLKRTFLLFLSANPLTKEMNLEFRELPELESEVLVLRDVALEVPDEDQG